MDPDPRTALVSPAPSPQAAQPAPRSPGHLFTAFTLLALQGFGGVLAVVQRELVERRRWLTPAQFVEDWAVAQTLPGPNVVNLALMIGDRHFGLRGALAALSGLLAAPLLIVVLLALLYVQWRHLPAVAGTLRGMAAVAAGLVAATGLKLVPALRGHPLGASGCTLLGAACFAGIALLRLPLAWVLLGLGGLSCIACWWRLAAAPGSGAHPDGRGSA